MWTQDRVSVLIAVAFVAWAVFMYIAAWVLRGCYISPDDED